MPVTEQRAKALGKAQGYESGCWWGSITGAVGAVVVSGLTVTVATVTAPVIIGGAAVAGAGYLVGGAVGGAVGAWRGEKAAENKAVLEPDATEEEIRSDAASKGGVAGGIAGGIAGVAIGTAAGSVANSPAAQRIPEVLNKKITEVLNYVEETPVTKLVGAAGGIAVTEKVSSLAGEYLHHYDDTIPT